jgi:hypothetical protein
MERYTRPTIASRTAFDRPRYSAAMIGKVEIRGALPEHSKIRAAPAIQMKGDSSRRRTAATGSPTAPEEPT